MQFFLIHQNLDEVSPWPATSHSTIYLLDANVLRPAGVINRVGCFCQKRLVCFCLFFTAMSPRFQVNYRWISVKTTERSALGAKLLKKEVNLYSSGICLWGPSSSLGCRSLKSRPRGARDQVIYLAKTPNHASNLAVVMSALLGDLPWGFRTTPRSLCSFKIN